MQIEMRPLNAVKPYERNPRLNDAAVDAVAESIERFGFRQPIVVDEAGVIIVGHTRWRAAQKLGLLEVPVHVATGLAPEQVRAYRIADNKTGELADWDLAALGLELAELGDASIDWSLLGFGEGELAKLLEGDIKQGLTDPDEIPEPPDEAKIQRGDIWILGDHRLMCGDSSSPADLDALLDGQPIHLVNMDPPYNVKVEPASAGAVTAGGGQRPSSWRSGKSQKQDGVRPARGGFQRNQAKAGKVKPKGRRLANDFVPESEFEELVLAWFANVARVLEPGRSFYIWGGGYPAEAGTKSNNELFPFTLRHLDLRFSQLIIWNKGSGVINRKDFMGQYEVCFYGWREGAAHHFFGPNNITDVWAVQKVTHQAMVHLTEKPVELAVRAMQYSSRPGENVLDLFGGSGSTLIAAEQTGRRAYSMELDPLYCDVIVERWEKFTGRKAERISDRRNAPAIAEAS